MSTNQPVTKIYELKTLGFQQLKKELKDVSDGFTAIKKAKQDASGNLFSAADKQKVNEYAKEIGKLAIEEQKLKVESQQLQKEIKAEQLIRQQAITASKASQNQYTAEIGSIKELRNQIKELNAAVINRAKGGDVTFQGQVLGYDQAINKLKELTAAEQDFRRQFAADKLLVGEYTSGIVQAFKQMGLDDLIGGQITKASERLNLLDSDFEKLKQELSQVGVNGAGNLEKIEKQLIENRREALALKDQVGQLSKEFAGAGNVGIQITESLKKGFQDAKGELGRYVLGYFGFQAALSGAQSVFTETTKLDSLNTSLRLVSGNEQELAINQKFLADTTERLGLVYTDTAVAFKNFFAASTQAGIGAEETRTIFEAATAAAANLKLSQEDTNGVLLAFGQIASKGKVQAEELRGQIGERIPGASAIAARALGVTEQQLNKLLETGQIGAKDFLPKFAAELNKTFGGDSTKKVNGLQAATNRLKNEFVSLLRDNQGGLTAFFEALVTGAGLLIKALPVLIGALAVYSAELLRAYIVTQTATEGTILYNVAQVAQATYARLSALAIKAATYELVLFNGALRISPIGIFLTALGLLIPTVSLFASQIDDAKRKSNAFNEVNEEAGKIYSQQISKIKLWSDILKSSTSSINTKKKAQEELNKVSTEFNGVLKDNTVNLQKLEQATNSVTTAIIKQARAQAAAKLVAEKSQNVQNLIAIETQLDIAAKSANGSQASVNLTESEKADLLSFLDPGQSTFRDAGGNKVTFQVSDYLINKKGEVGKLQAQINAEIEKRTNLLKNYLQVQEDAQKAADGLINQGTGELTKLPDIDISAIKGEIQKIDNLINNFKGSAETLEDYIKTRELLQKRLDALLNKQKPSSASKLTGEQKDQFKTIEADRDRLLALEETKLLKSEQTESQYLKNILKINQDAIDQKLKLLKARTPEELKVEAELQLDRVRLANDTTAKLADIARTQLNNVIKSLEEERDATIAAAEETARQVDATPGVSNEARAQTKLDADRKILEAQVNFARQLSLLEQATGVESVKTTRETNDQIIALKRKLNQDQIDLEKSRLADLDKTIATQEARIRANGANNRQPDGLTQIEVLDAKIPLLRERLKIIKGLLDQGITDQQEYYNADRDLADAEKALVEARVSQINGQLSNLSGLRQRLSTFLSKKLFNDFKNEDGSTDTNSQALFAVAVTHGYDLASQAMNNYFDQERARINENLQLAQERLDREKQQRLDRATSQAEEAAINKKYDAEKRKLDRDAFEQLKKSKRSEARLALVAELANIAVAASANPANAATFGAAGALQFAVLSALALGRFAIRTSEINREKFAFGGQPDTSTTRGGFVKGRSHARGGNPFLFKGRVFEDEVDEINVIRTKDAPRNKIFNLAGTQAQIASALNVAGGGIDFAPGATSVRFAYGGQLGESLQPPVFVPNLSSTIMTLNQAGLEEKVDRLADAVIMHADETSKRIDRLQVIQDTNTVIDSTKKIVKQTEIGVL